MLAGVRSLFSRVFPAHRSLESDESLIRMNGNFNDEHESDQPIYSTKRTNGKVRRSVSEDGFGCSTTPTESRQQSSRTAETNECNRLASAMQIAISRCNIDTIQRLSKNFQLNLNYRDQYGMTYLEHAILIGNVDIVDLLIRYGCDLSQGNQTNFILTFDAVLLFRLISGFTQPHMFIRGD